MPEASFAPETNSPIFLFTISEKKVTQSAETSAYFTINKTPITNLT